MTDRELEQRIFTAVGHAVPNDADRILLRCRREDQIFSRSHAPDPLSGRTAASYRVILDVNPSVYLEVDGEEHILRAEALNDDAADMPGAEELVGLPLETAVDAIVEYMVHEGYLSGIQNSILVSVEGQSSGCDNEVQKRVSDIVGEIMEETLGGTRDGAAVLSQTMDGEDDELADLALEYGISMGKAALIRSVAAEEAVCDTGEDGDSLRPALGDLAPLTVNEIALIARDLRIPDGILTQTGRASERAYIGHDGALQAAADRAGLDISQVIKPKVTLDASGGRMVYDVKLKTTVGTFKYVLDARTGEEVRGRKEQRTEEERRNEMGKKKKKYNMYYQADYGMNGASGVAQPGAGGEQPVRVPDGAVGEQTAKEAALRHAGVAESQALYVYCNPQIGHGPDHYDVKFVANGFKYKYSIGLYDGTVLGRAVKNKAAKGKYIYEGNYHEHYAPMGPGMAQPSAGMPRTETDRPDGTASPSGEQPAAKAPAGEMPVEGSMISEQDAFAIALRQAGLAQNDLIRWKVKLRSKHGRLLYRFKLKIPGFEHEIDVDAYTGAVTKSHKEFDS